MNMEAGRPQSADAQKMLQLFAGAVVIIALIGAAVYWFLIPHGASDEDAATGGDSTQNISNATRNPGESVPQANPFEETKTNPFTEYKNPFQ